MIINCSSLFYQGAIEIFDTMIVFKENSNDIQQTLDQVKLGNNLKTIVVTSEDNFEVFLETLAQFQKNSHFIVCSYENNIKG